MKLKIAIIVALFAAITLNADPTPAPIVIPAPVVKSVTQPMAITLTAAQVQLLVKALKDNAGITFPAGVTGFNFNAIQTGSNAGGAQVTLRFQ